MALTGPFAVNQMPEPIVPCETVDMSDTPPTDHDRLFQAFEQIAGRSGDITAALYEEVFRRWPTYEALFALDGGDTVKGAMLEQCLTALLDHAEGTPSARTIVAVERSNHHSYGVVDADFCAFFEVLEHVLKQSGEAWSPEVSAAYRRTVTSLLDPAPVN